MPYSFDLQIHNFYKFTKVELNKTKYPNEIYSPAKGRCLAFYEYPFFFFFKWEESLYVQYCNHTFLYLLGFIFFIFKGGPTSDGCISWLSGTHMSTLQNIYIDKHSTTFFWFQRWAPHLSAAFVITWSPYICSSSQEF